MWHVAWRFPCLFKLLFITQTGNMNMNHCFGQQVTIPFTVTSSLSPHFRFVISFTIIALHWNKLQRQELKCNAHSTYFLNRIATFNSHAITVVHWVTWGWGYVIMYVQEWRLACRNASLCRDLSRRTISNTLSSSMTSCGLLESSEDQGLQVPPKLRQMFTRPHGVTFRKPLFILTAVNLESHSK
jgi:hypothetical protein